MMEGREYSTNDNVYANHYIKPNSNDEEEFDLISNDGTYVIQVPKDQIYRVPPPENSLLAERYRTTIRKRNTCFSINCMVLFILILTFVIAFITGISVAVADKEDPTFRVRRIYVITKGQGNNKQHDFHFTLRSKNPNGRAVISFDKGGNASLSYKDKPIAKGKFPSFKEDTDSLENIKLKIKSGSIKTLPKLIKKSMNGLRNRPIKLSLRFNVLANFNVGIFPVKSKTLSMVCDLKVNKLTKNARILSQDCDYAMIHGH